MNDDDHHQDQSSDDGDTALEARLVAWVLGEASAFEAAELERLVSTQPEIALFKRRIEAVHGLLGEAVDVRKTDTLRLAPERRAKVLATLGVAASEGGTTPTAVLEPAPAKRRRLSFSPEWKALRLYFGTAAACVLVFFVVQVSTRRFGHFASSPEFEKARELRMEKVRAQVAAEIAMEQLEARSDDSTVLMLEPPMLADTPAPTADWSESVSADAITVPVNRSIGAARIAQHHEFRMLDAEPETVPEGDDDQRIALDEFKVTATREEGYAAASTLAGARMSTNLRDIGSAVTLSQSYGASAPATGGPGARSGSSYKSERDGGASAGESAQGDGTDAWSAGFGLAAAEPHAAASPVTIVTQEFLRDTGVSDNSSLLQYTANTEVGGMQGSFSGRYSLDAPDSSNRKQQPASAHADGTTRSIDVTWSAGFDTPQATDGVVVGGKEHAFSQNLNQPFLEQGDASSLRVQGVVGGPRRLQAQAPPTKPAPVATPPPPMAKDKAAPREADEKSTRAKAPTPAPTAIDEAHAAKEPVSTFSLHVSDASFKLAQAALARGQVPDASTIRPEEFYNAFDYGDPSPTLDQKVACRIEQAAHPFLQQRTLVRVAMKVANTGRGAGQPLRLTVVLDTSGSMEREDRVASVQRALEVLASLLGPNDRVTLIGFARQPRLLAEAVRGDQAGQLADLARRTPADGGTNMEEALKLAEQLAQRHFEVSAQNRVVLLTDGAANLGNADPAQLAMRIEALRGRGIAFDACGVGTDGLDDEILEALTRRGDGRYYVLDSPADADGGFARQLAGAFRPAAKNVKVQVRFNPARVGAYRLLGFEKHRLREEDFRNDKVDAAELAAEEAAVAVYQVEVLPEGEGDLGDVFVRFRDMADGRMVERSWTIAHDARARAFDQASLSLQLAGTSALLAEVLRGGALGDQVDLDALAPVVGRLRNHYASQPRVQDLATMFEQLRRQTGR